MQKKVALHHNKHHSNRKRQALSRRCVCKRPKKVRITPRKAIATTTRKKRTANAGEVFKSISTFLNAIINTIVPVAKMLLYFIGKTNSK